MSLYYAVLIAALLISCTIAANESVVSDGHVDNPTKTTITRTKVVQLGTARTAEARQGRLLDAPDAEVHAEYRALHSEESHHEGENDPEELVHSTEHHISNTVNETGHISGGEFVDDPLSEGPHKIIEDNGKIENSTQMNGRLMDYAGRSVLTAKEIKSKAVHFSKQDRRSEDVVLYRPRGRSREGYQRSRILVQKHTGADRQRSASQPTILSDSMVKSGRTREVHRGKSQFYDSSAELVGMASDDAPEIVHVKSHVVPDDCNGQKGAAACKTLPTTTTEAGEKAISATSTKSPFETRVAGQHPEWTTILAVPNATQSGIRLAKTMLHYDSKESESLPTEAADQAEEGEEVEGKQNDYGQRSDEASEGRSDDGPASSRSQSRATSGRSLFKLLSGQQHSGSSSYASDKNGTSIGKASDKEGKMNPFRFGLQQLFTPRLPVGYAPMMTYAPPQYAAGSLLYPTRAPLLPLYTTTALLPAAAQMAATAKPTTPSKGVVANAGSKGEEATTTTPAPPDCPGECVDVFAALMCGQVDEEARCALSNQRCCVGGTEQVNKFLKRHGSLTKKRRKHSKKYLKSKQHKESSPLVADSGVGQRDSVEIAIAKGDHDEDVQKIVVHSTTTTSAGLSKGSSTKRPALIQLSSGNGVLQVIGPKDQLWSTRYPEIPKYVTIITTTRRPHKPPRDHATRRMDSVYEDNDTSPNESAEIDQMAQEEESRGSTRRPKHKQDDHRKHDEDDEEHSPFEQLPTPDEPELEMIESAVHEVKVKPTRKRAEGHKRNSQKRHRQRPPTVPLMSHENLIDEDRKSSTEDDAVVETTNDTHSDGSPIEATEEHHPPLCPGNCVLPLFSLFCDPDFKTSHVCAAPGRVCCVGTSARSPEKAEPLIKTTAAPSHTEDTVNGDEGHDQECLGRCVAVFFQYTCRHPFRITDDICPSGSLCCTEGLESTADPHNHANNGEQGESQDGTVNEVDKVSSEQQEQQEHDATESAKKKLNLIHSILSTVLSTKRPKPSSNTEDVSSGDSSQRHGLRHRSRAPMGNFVDDPMRPDETRMRPTYAAPYEPKYFPTGEAHPQGTSASEESSDPPEVVIEPAIPTRPTLDTRFSQLDRPPMAPEAEPAFPPFSPPFRHRKTHYLPHDAPPNHYGRDPSAPRYHPAYSRPGRVRPPLPRPSLHNNQQIPPEEQDDEGSPESAAPPMRPPYRPPYMRYPPYRRFRTPLSPPPFLRPNDTLHDDHRYPPFEEEDDLPDHSLEQSNHVNEAEVSREEMEHSTPPHFSVPPSTSETSLGDNFSSPFVSEWTPTDVNVARVKEVNAVTPSQSEELPFKASHGGVHPSSCGLNGFHIKRGIEGQNNVRTAKPGEWCWQAAIVDSEDRLLCSGAVIGAQWIVTSASCLLKANFTSSTSAQTNGLRAKIGYVDLRASEGSFTRGPVGSQTKTISMVYSHHNFNSERRDNDIALLKLHDFIDLNGVVCVICLPSTIRPDRAIENCTVTAYRHEAQKATSIPGGFNNGGIAATSNASSPRKVRLTFERVSKIDSQVCTDLAALRGHGFFFHSNGTSVSSVSRSKFCAGDIDKAERTATCQVASVEADLVSPSAIPRHRQAAQMERASGTEVVGLGNPLVCRVDDEFYQLNGISSVFLGCSNPASPTVFTNLAYYTGWINQITNVNRYS